MKTNPLALQHFVNSHYSLSIEILTPLDSYDDQNFMGDGHYVIKLSHPRERRTYLEAQNEAMARIQLAPEVVATPAGDRIVEYIDPEHGTAQLLRVLRYIPGQFMGECSEHSDALLRDIGAQFGRLSTALQSFQHPGAYRSLYWDLRNIHAVEADIALLHDPAKRRLLAHFFLQLECQLLPILPRLRCGIIHNDGNDYNILIDPADPDRIKAIIDFGDMIHGIVASEIAIVCTYAMLKKDVPLQAAALALGAYHQHFPLTPVERQALPYLIIARLSLSVLSSNKARIQRPENEYISITEPDAWRLLEQLAATHPEEIQAVFAQACQHPYPSLRKKDSLLDSRHNHLSRSLSLQYSSPLHIFRGIGPYLYADTGKRYLDLVNNVCHVGHNNPKVVRALRNQASLLNTNTRYLHQNILDYTARLTATLPDPLSVCFLVCTGSEANELAVRLARTHTGGEDFIVVDGAYHGHSSTLIDLSPYKYEGKGGCGQADFVQKAQMPDSYRGPHRGPDAGPKYAKDVLRCAQEIKKQDRRLAGFFCESLLGCGGQLVLPDRYLQSAYAYVRENGGVCIADEVQVGFGRVGSHFWGFETQGVVPDIVTMGKPMGNGHPLAAVVTTPQIAQSFCNGMEYFNTFGGNPVSCAVGLAVLDAIEEDSLQERAQLLGQYMKDALRGMAAEYTLIGDVRGLGLFIGIELVLDRETRAPAAQEASWIIDEMKERQILLSTDGPLHNVIKIKPPMVLSKEDVDFFLHNLRALLARWKERSLSH